MVGMFRILQKSCQFSVLSEQSQGVTEGYFNGDLDEVEVGQKDVDDVPADDESGVGVEDSAAEHAFLDEGGFGDLAFGQFFDYFPLESADVLVSVLSLELSVLDKISTTT